MWRVTQANEQAAGVSQRGNSSAGNGGESDERGREVAPVRRFYRRSGLRRIMRRRRDATLYQLTRFALWSVPRLRLPRALAIADRAGGLVYPAMPGIRRLALDHLAIAFGDTLSAAAREEIARDAYRSIARCAVELAKIDEIRASFDEYASIEGLDHLAKLRALGRGCIVMTGHIGNWELLAAYVASKNFSVAAAARRIKDPRLNRLVTDFRASNGVRTFMRSSQPSASEILRILKQGGILALQLDLDIPVPSVSVPFFGRLARTPAGAAVLSVRRDVPVVPAFARRRPEGGHHFTIMAPIYPPKTGDRLRDILELTREYSRILEDHIRRSPAEWNWWHRRWRRRPVLGLDLDAETQPSNLVSP